MERKGSKDRKTEEEIIQIGMDFNIEHVIRRFSRDHDVPLEMAARYERELKRYLLLCALHPRSKYGMRGPVDDLWHVFVFFTKDYFAFCQAIAGTYIHHVPEDPDAKQWEGRKSTYPKMLKAYRVVFGEDAPLDIWPAFKKDDTLSTMSDPSCGNRCSGSCDSCGGGGTSCNGGCSGCDTCGPD